jgi:hypothetical protein
MYTNQLLARSPGLIGKKIEIQVNVDDLRIVKAYLPDGSELGKLKAMGKWGLIPHTLQVRKEIFKLKNQKLIQFTSSDNPIEVYQRFLEDRTGKTTTIQSNQDRSNEHVIEVYTEVPTTAFEEDNNGQNSSINNVPSKQKYQERRFRKTIIY